MYIIAECGVNHEGNIETAKQMIYAAKEVGADAVKFTCYIAENYINKNFKERFKLAKKFELSKENFIELHDLAKKCNIEFILTPLCFQTLEFARKYCNIIKIASGDIIYSNFLYAASQTDREIIISTAASNILEIKNAVRMLEVHRRSITNTVSILHCIASYPTQQTDVNLNSILYLREKFPNNIIGYSDHTNDTFACELAVLMGAQIIEKHFTLDRNGKTFHDHFISANTDEFKKMVDKIRFIPYMLGLKEKKCFLCEIEKRDYLRRGMVAITDIGCGDTITNEKIKMVRPKI